MCWRNSKFTCHHTPHSPHSPPEPPPLSLSHPHTPSPSARTSPPRSSPSSRFLHRPWALAAMRSAHNGGWAHSRANSNATGTTTTTTTTLSCATTTLTRSFHHGRAPRGAAPASTGGPRTYAQHEQTLPHTHNDRDNHDERQLPQTITSTASTSLRSAWGWEHNTTITTTVNTDAVCARKTNDDNHCENPDRLQGTMRPRRAQ